MRYSGSGEGGRRAIISYFQRRSNSTRGTLNRGCCGLRRRPCSPTGWHNSHQGCDNPCPHLAWADANPPLPHPRGLRPQLSILFESAHPPSTRSAEEDLDLSEDGSLSSRGSRGRGPAGRQVGTPPSLWPHVSDGHPGCHSHADSNCSTQSACRNAQEVFGSAQTACGCPAAEPDPCAFIVHPKRHPWKPASPGQPTQLLVPSQLLPATDTDWFCQQFHNKLLKSSWCPEFAPTDITNSFHVDASSKNSMTASPLTLGGFRCPKGTGALTTRLCRNTGRSSRSSYWQGHQYCGVEWVENNLDVRLIYGHLRTFCGAVHSFPVLTAQAYKRHAHMGSMLSSILSTWLKK